MIKGILWLLVGYLAVIGLVRVVAGIVDLLCPPRPPQGCRPYLTVNEDADYTESSLISCHRLLRRGETGGLPYVVLLPQAPEAAEICRRYCRDWHMETLDLPPMTKWCMIRKDDTEKEGEPQENGAGMGKDLRNRGGCDLPQ